MNLSVPPVTREHGSWAILFVPMILGIIAAPVIDISALMIAIAVSFFFMAYIPIELLMRGDRTVNNYFWTLVFGVGGSSSALYLMLGYRRYWLPAFAAAAALLYVLKVFLEKKRGKNLWSDNTGILMLTLSAPAARYATAGVMDNTAIGLYIISAAYFVTGGIYVHLLIKGIKDSRAKHNGARVLLLCALAVLSMLVWIYGWSMLLVFTPIFVFVFTELFSAKERRPDFKKTGLQLLLHSFWFMAAVYIFL